MFKTLKSRLPRSLSRSRSRKAATAPPEAQNPEPITAEKAPAPYLPTPQRKTSTLFELEALLSSIIDSHHHCGQDARAVVEGGEKALEGSRGGGGGGGGVLPSYEELYRELEGEKDDVEPQVPEISGFRTAQCVPHLSYSQQPTPPILRRKPKGLVGHKRSTREKALEALMRLLDQCEDDEEDEEERAKRARRFPSVESMGAVRRRALEGLRRRGWDVTVISSGSRRGDRQDVLHAVS